MSTYESVVEQHLQVGSRSGKEWMVRCPYHDNASFTMQFNVESGLWLCFSCGATGNAKRLVRDLGGTWIEGGTEDLDDLRIKLDALKQQAPGPVQDTILPESALRRYRFPTDYWTSRGFTGTTIAAFDLGYDPLDNYVTIPARNAHGQLLGIIKRYLDDDALVRYRYPKGFHRGRNLFASWLVAQDDRDHVVLVEGAVDAMKVWQAGFPALAVYGSSISVEQFALLRRLDVHHVTTFFDNDTAGRKATYNAYGYKMKIRRGRKTNEYVRALDLRTEFLVDTVTYKRMPNDPGACDSSQIRNAIASAGEFAIT